MKRLFRFGVLLLVFSFSNLLQAQCANASNIYTFTYNNTTYELVKELKTWTDAASCAVSRGGILAEINDSSEQSAIFNEILNNGGLSFGTSVPTIPLGNGNGSFVWLGGNDITTEGEWMWDGGNAGGTNQFWSGNGSGVPINSSFENWATGFIFDQPNDRQGQDALALSINSWTNGNASDWRDIDKDNTLYYLIEVLFNPNDSIAPVADSATLRPVSAQCFIANPVIPTATDNFAGIVNGVSDINFPIIGVGSYTVTWTFSDFSGNSSTQTQIFNIIDTIAPVPISSTINDFSADCSVNSFPLTLANDNCEGQIIGTTTTSLPITAIGTTVVTWSFDDGNGNITNYDQIITILDSIPPVLDQSLPFISSNCPIQNLPPPTATDNCSGVIVGSTTTTFPITNSDTTTVIWEFVDNAGNILTEQQIIYINPIFSSIVSDGAILTAVETGLTYQWLDCENNFSEIQNATNQSFTVPNNGSYCVVVSDGECQDTSDCILITDLSLQANEDNIKLKVFPNPTPHDILIQNLNPTVIYTLELTDINGKLIIREGFQGKHNHHVAINESSGVYLLTIRSNKGSSVFKVIKQE